MFAVFFLFFFIFGQTAASDQSQHAHLPCSAASHHPAPTPSSREAGRVPDPTGSWNREREKIAHGGQGRRAAPAASGESQQAEPSPDISKTNLCPGFHDLGRAPPPGGR